MSKKTESEKIRDELINIYLAIKLRKEEEVNIENEELTYIKLIQRLFFIGHKNGKISVWKVDSNNFLECFKSSSDYHNNEITKMILKSVDENSNYLITSSIDKSVCVINLDSNMSLIEKKVFEESVKDIYNNIDFEGRDNFFVVLSNGKIIVLNDSFNSIYEINTRVSSSFRNCVSLINPQKSELMGNFLIISDGTNIDINIWIKEGSYKLIQNPNGNNGHSNNNNFRGGIGGYKGMGGY